MNKVLKSLSKRLKITPIWQNRWVLNASFTYDIWYKGSKKKITIPEWFTFDWASLPRVFYIVWTPMATDTLIAALIHDFVYKQQKLTREECDELFNEVMLITWVRHLKRVIYYIWVRLWGWVAYNNHKKVRQKAK